MKKFAILISFILSSQSFAESVTYTGSNQGAACTVNVDLARNYVSMGGIGLIARSKKQEGNVLVLKGGADFEDARITLKLKNANEVDSAKLETKNMLIPFYRTKLNCTNLVRTK